MSHIMRSASLRVPVAPSTISKSCLRSHAATTARAAPCASAFRQQLATGRGHAVRGLRSSRAWKNDDMEEARRIHARDVEEQSQKIKSTKSAQRKVDDRPWQREGNPAQPESTSPDPSGGDGSKGRLLTTPTRLLKLILPMPFHPEQEHINEDDKKTSRRPEIEQVDPLALLVHPQQPLSYLERLIQAEIPPVKVGPREKLPDIVFRAEADYEENPGEKSKDGQRDNVAQYSGLGREGPQRSETNWVRWSGSTEVGDFIRDAARGREFAINIEGYEREIRVAVPSFKDRTYYMRMRLRRMSRQIAAMSKIKHECDNLAHQGAHRLAQGGFFALTTWWGIVYYVTFHTDAGWDLVEPVTYLAGLTTIMGGYLWFLFISKDLSYKAAMNVTVSRRQNALYQEKGFDQQRWENIVHEANQLRREIREVATEYDQEWNEMRDLGQSDVKEVLEQEEEDAEDKKKKRRRGDDERDDKQEKKDKAEGAKE